MNARKRILKLSLFLILVFTVTMTNVIPVQAKSKVKLKNSKVTLTVGQSKSLKVVGTKKKVKWTSSNTKIVSVNKKGKIKAKKKGNCKVYARVGKKKLTCKITVKEKPKKKTSKKTTKNTVKNNVTYSSYATNHGVVILVKNNYSYTVGVDADCLFYNSKGSMIEKSSDSNYALEPGRECALFAWISHSDWSSHKINLKVEKADNVISNVSGIKVTFNTGNQNVMVTAKNNGRKNAFTQIAVVYYKNNKVIGYESHYADIKNKGTTDYLEFAYPYDWDYNTITPDRYVVYVNNSYTYSWMK